MIKRLRQCNKKAFLIAKLKINILYCLGLILKMLILVLIYKKNNIYNKKNPCIHTFFIYKGLMQGFVVQSILCERLFCALLYRHLFFFATCAE